MDSTPRIRLGFLPILLFFLVGTGCDSDPAAEDEIPAPAVIIVEDLPADPFVAFAPDGRPIGTGRFTFFSLRDNREMATSDSASTTWDIAVRGTDILINGGSSGPGNGAAQIVEGIFEEVVEAPADGWRLDGDTGPAIFAGSGNGWYNYNPAAMVVSPIPGRVLLIRTADGRYAKLRLLSYYKGAPDTPTADSEARYLTFEYLFQPDGSRNLQ